MGTVPEGCDQKEVALSLEHDNGGIINNIIDCLSFEIHPRGYRFCGPGTRLAERLQRGEEGVNPLDDFCREHDIAYSDTKTDRTKADRLLAKRAFCRMLSETSSNDEKAVALLTTCCMLSKITFDTLSKCIKKLVKKSVKKRVKKFLKGRKKNEPRP